MDADDTGGQFSAMEVTVRKGLEPPPHEHEREDESYYILEGTWTVRVGDQTLMATPGSLVFLPRGIQHSFTVDVDGARALVLCTPGGLERAFKAMSEPAGALVLPPPPQGPPPIDRMLEILGRENIHFAAPPQTR